MLIKKVFSNESLTVLLYTVIAMFGTLATMKILAISLTKEEYGVYALILSITAFLGLFPFRGFEQAATRYVSINRNENKFSEFYSNYIFLFLLTILIYIFIFISVDISNINLGIFTEYLWIIFSFLVSEAIKISLRTIVGADRKRVEILISSSLEFSFKILVLLILADIAIENLFLLFIIVNLISSIKLFIENKNDLRLNVINKMNFLFHNKRLWLFAYPFLIMAIFTWARDMSNRWIIDIYLDKESVALYSVLTSIALIIPMGIQTILGSYIVPIIYQKENIQKGFARKVTNLLFIIFPVFFLLTSCFVYIFSSEIITLFSSNKYIYDSWVLTSLYLAYSMYTLAMFSVYEILAKQQSIKLIIPSIVSGVLSVVSGLIMIKLYGFNGAIYSYVIGYTSYAILIFSTVLKYRKEEDVNSFKQV